jgi:hypothetical protein
MVVAPVTLEAYPPEQRVQLIVPGVVEYDPVGHSEHVVEPGEEA